MALVVNAYLYCDVCGLLHDQQNGNTQVWLKASATGWQLPNGWFFSSHDSMEGTLLVCSVTCEARIGEARERKAQGASPIEPDRESLHCKGCHTGIYRYARGQQFYVLPPGVLDLEPRLPYFMCARCTARPEHLAKHQKIAHDWINDDSDLY